MRRYKQFGRKEFEYGVREFLIQNRLGFLKDITEQYIAEGNTTWEHVYSISTANKAVELIEKNGIISLISA